MNVPCKLALAAVVGLSGFPSVVLGQSAMSVAAAAIDSIVDSTMRARGIAGATIAIVAGGMPVYQRGYGMADRAAKRRVSADSTPFGLSSISKVFTTIALLKQVERGRIQLDAPVSGYLGELRVPDDVQVWHLLTHTAGFDDLTIGVSARSAEAVLPLRQYLRRDLPSSVRRPGEVASYSNHGFVLAGLLVEETSGQRFDRFVTQEVLRPLGMTMSGFEQPLPAALEAARATPYRRNGTVVPRIFFNDSPASAMYSTAADMGRFMIAFMRRDTALGVLRDWRPMQERRFAHQQLLNGLTFGMRQRRDGEVSSLEQGGDWTDYSSDLIVSPDAQQGLFIAFSGAGASRAADSIWKRLVRAPSPPATAGSGASVTFNGDYRINRYSRATIARLGILTGAIRQLSVTDNRLLGMPLDSVAPDVYRIRGGQLIAVARSPRGEAVRLFLNNAPQIAYDRIRWWERRDLHLAAFLVSLLVMIAVIVRALRRWRKTQVDKAARLWRAAMTTWASSGLLLILGLALLMATTDFDEFQYGLPVRIQLVLGIGAVSMVAGLVAVAASPFMRQRSASAFAATAIAALWSAVINYWNLLPHV